MTQKYISPSNTYSFEYPDDWKLERQNGGILNLCKKGGLFKKESQNTLSITPMVSDQVISPEAYQALLNLRKKEHSDLEIIEKSDSFVMNFHILKYQKEAYQDIGERTFLMLQDFWELIISNRIFTCFYSVKKDEAGSSKAKEEKEIAEKILFSLRLL
jgi:hypothetical protein